MWYKIRHTGWQTNVADSNTKEFQPVKLNFPFFRCPSGGCHVFLPSSMADFVPCDQLVQKAHKTGMGVIQI